MTTVLNKNYVLSALFRMDISSHEITTFATFSNKHRNDRKWDNIFH